MGRLTLENEVLKGGLEVKLAWAKLTRSGAASSDRVAEFPETVAVLLRSGRGKRLCV